MKSIIISQFIIILFLSCSPEKQPNNAEQSNNQVLLLSGEKNFILDNNTTMRVETLSYSEKDSLVITYTNASKQLTVFDYKTGKIINAKKLKKVSPHEIFIKNQDTVVVFDINDKTLIQLDKELNVVSKVPFSLGKDLKTFTLNPRFSNELPIVFYKNRMFIACWGLGEYPDIVKKREERPILIEYTPNNNNRNYLSGYPRFYIENNLGSFNNWVLNSTYNEDDNSLVFSFKASCQLLKYQLEAKRETFVNVKSSYFDTIPLPHKGKGRHYAMQSESYYHYINHPSYDRIIYDKYRGVYYRFVLHGVDNPDMSKGPKVFFDKKISIIVTDKNFRVLGETEQFDGHYSIQSFVSPEGLHILKMTGNEDLATYSIFTLNKSYEK